MIGNVLPPDIEPIGSGIVNAYAAVQAAASLP